MSHLRVRLVKSLIGQQWRARRVVEGMGFTKLQQTRTFPDNPSIRGMIRRVNHLLTFEEVPDAESGATANSAASSVSAGSAAGSEPAPRGTAAAPSAPSGAAPAIAKEAE